MECLNVNCVHEDGKCTLTQEEYDNCEECLMARKDAVTKLQMNEIERLRNKVKKAKKLEKQIIYLVVKMAAESMEPIHFESFEDAIKYMMKVREIETSGIF